jgi:hypothetical protein
MRIVKSVQTKVCVDGSLMKEFVLDEPLSPAFLQFLAEFGPVRSMELSGKPYFSFEKELFVSIKGFAGDTSVEVRYRKEYQDLTADYFHLLLHYCGEGAPGIVKMKGIEESIAGKIKTRRAVT